MTSPMANRQLGQRDGTIQCEQERTRVKPMPQGVVKLLRPPWIPAAIVIASYVFSLLVYPHNLAFATPPPKDVTEASDTEMQEPWTKSLQSEPDYAAPDGSNVRLLVDGQNGNMAHFELAPGHTSQAVAHHTVEELWFILSGRGEMWRKNETTEEVTELTPGVSIRIPTGTHFQFRAFGDENLTAVAVSMPPWPGAEEAYEVPNKWPTEVPDANE